MGKHLSDSVPEDCPGLDAVLKDVAEIKNVLKELKETKSKEHVEKMDILDALEMVSPVLPTMVYWHDLDGVVLGANDICLKEIGETRDIIGKSPYEFYTDDVAKHILDHNKKIIETGKISSQYEKNNTKRVYQSIKAPLRDKTGKIIGIIGSSINVTNEKEAELLKEQFIRNMQHDIRTPAAGIHGLMRVLMDSEPDKERKKLLKMAVNSSEQLLDLCNETVEFGELDDEIQPVYKGKFSLIDLVSGIVELNRPAAFSKAVQLELIVDENVPIYIITDKFRLSRIVLNLLGNAVKFTNEGEILMKVGVEMKKQREGILIIDIKDTGIGIPADKIHTIFQKFSRAFESNTGRYPGTDLGLYIVEKFTNDLEGDIEVESTENKGTVFRLTIPFKVPLLFNGT